MAHLNARRRGPLRPSTGRSLTGMIAQAPCSSGMTMGLDWRRGRCSTRISSPPSKSICPAGRAAGSPAGGSESRRTSPGAGSCSRRARTGAAAESAGFDRRRRSARPAPHDPRASRPRPSRLALQALAPGASRGVGQSRRSAATKVGQGVAQSICTRPGRTQAAPRSRWSGSVSFRRPRTAARAVAQVSGIDQRRRSRRNPRDPELSCSASGRECRHGLDGRCAMRWRGHDARRRS